MEKIQYRPEVIQNIKDHAATCEMPEAEYMTVDTVDGPINLSILDVIDHIERRTSIGIVSYKAWASLMNKEKKHKMPEPPLAQTRQRYDDAKLLQQFMSDYLAVRDEQLRVHLGLEYENIPGEFITPENLNDNVMDGIIKGLDAKLSQRVGNPSPN